MSEAATPNRSKTPGQMSHWVCRDFTVRLDALRRGLQTHGLAGWQPDDASWLLEAAGTCHAVAWMLHRLLRNTQRTLSDRARGGWHAAEPPEAARMVEVLDVLLDGVSGVLPDSCDEGIRAAVARRGVERDIEHARLMAGLYEIAHEVAELVRRSPDGYFRTWGSKDPAEVAIERLVKEIRGKIAPA